MIKPNIGNVWPIVVALHMAPALMNFKVIMTKTILSSINVHLRLSQKKQQ